MLTADERETIIRFNDADDWVYIWTAQEEVIEHIRAQEIEEVASGHFDESLFAEFKIPLASWNLLTGFLHHPRCHQSHQH